jgi:hypothetical protein
MSDPILNSPPKPGLRGQSCQNDIRSQKQYLRGKAAGAKPPHIAREADMTMVHKILHGRGDLDHDTWFEKAENGPRATRNTADPFNLRVKHGRMDMRRNFFSTWYPGYRRLEPDTGRTEKN